MCPFLPAYTMVELPRMKHMVHPVDSRHSIKTQGRERRVPSPRTFWNALFGRYLLPAFFAPAFCFSGGFLHRCTFLLSCCHSSSPSWFLCQRLYSTTSNFKIQYLVFPPGIYRMSYRIQVSQGHKNAAALDAQKESIDTICAFYDGVFRCDVRRSAWYRLDGDRFRV